MSMSHGYHKAVRSQILALSSVLNSSMSQEQARAFIETGSLEGVSDEPPPEPYNPDVVKLLASGRGF